MTPCCELCGYTGTMQAYYPRLRIVQCPACALVFFAGEAAVADLYTEAYFKGEEYQDYVRDKAIIQGNFARRIEELRRLRPEGRLLELGSAYGFFLELASRHWQARGLDITPEGVAYARDVLGLDAVQADFLSLPDEPEAYDLIVMWDTIEHLEHPVRFVEKAARWLKPGGALVVTTGDIDSLMSRWRQDRWRLIHPPTHLYYFSPDTLGRAMRQAGLEVRRVSHVGYARSLRTMVHGMLTLKRPEAREEAERLARLVPDWQLYLNLYDIMQMVAVKPEAPARALAG